MENAQLQLSAHLSQLVRLSGQYIDSPLTRANSSPTDNPQANTSIQSAVLTLECVRLSVRMREGGKERDDEDTRRLFLCVEMKMYV